MPQNKLTSLKNPRIQNLIKLRDRKERQTQGLTIVEGLREVFLAQQSGVVFQQLFLCRELLRKEGGIDKILSRKTAVFEVSQEIFAKIAFGERHEGILAVVSPKLFRLEDLRFKKDPLCCVVEALEKPGNLGAILRSCDGVGAEGVLVCDGKTDIYNPNVIRASLGSVFSVKVVGTTNEAALKFLRDHKMKICVTSPQASSIYYQVDLTGPLAVVLGSEHQGLSDFWMRHADMQVKIPIKGSVDSLNVATTAGIVMYEAFRQRNKGGFEDL